MPLPERDSLAEDAWVKALADADDVDALQQAATDAMDARRPALAARLVGLLGDRVEIEPGSALERAHKAARLFLVDPKADHNARLLDEAWREARQLRLRRIKRRMRQSGRLDGPRVGRFGRDRRR